MNGPPSSTPRMPCRVQTIGTPRARHSSSSAFVGSITRRMCAMSILVRRVPAVGVEEVVLVVDDDVHGPARHEPPGRGS